MLKLPLLQYYSILVDGRANEWMNEWMNERTNGMGQKKRTKNNIENKCVTTLPRYYLRAI